MRNICKTPLQGNQAVLNFLTVAKPLWLTRIFIQNLKMVSSVRIFLSGRIRMVLILTQKKKSLPGMIFGYVKTFIFPMQGQEWSSALGCSEVSMSGESQDWLLLFFPLWGSPWRIFLLRGNTNFFSSIINLDNPFLQNTNPHLVKYSCTINP